ncbi:acetyltransferase [Sphingomonas sp. RIT328]|uniref:acetyltransferase n=1 Tax=Sphingomonas sp. RIT328 TaxID=1470591 RepID=UPI0004473261|nr:acetyltransferase [Sphingomonas sp. RIT328]EZP55115.1 putative serine O-acetyltransferase [Sphingomonas sp. RIT328]
MEKGRTIIVGAGGFGRELINWAEDCNLSGLLPAVAGFIDDDENAMNGFDYPVGMLGSISDYYPVAGDRLLMAIGTPITKQKVFESLNARGCVFASLIHPRAIVANTARISEGAIVCPLSLISADATLGRFVSVNALSSVGHDVTIGDYSTLSAHVDLTGGVALDTGVTIGTGAKLLPRVKVGAGAMIGAGSIVYRNVPAGRSVFAAPAKLLGVTTAKIAAP